VKLTTRRVALLSLVGSTIQCQRWTAIFR
jgi:hypothetical protein